MSGRSRAPLLASYAGRWERMGKIFTMAQLYKALGRNREFPQLESVGVASSAVNVNFEHPIAMVPNLASVAGSGNSGFVQPSAMHLREIYLIAEAALTGANTNTVTLNILQKRGGAILVNTTSSTAVSAAGSVVITPASMANITVNSILSITGGTGTAENVTVSAVTPTTFTATFANTHSGTYNIQSVPLASIAFVSGTNLATLVPTLLKPLANNTILPGDVITVQTVNAGTGLATPAMLVQFDWEIAL